MNNSWQAQRLSEVATLQRGFDLPTQNRVAGRFPLISSSGISDTHDKYAVKGPGVVTGRSGSIGSVFFIEDDFWPLNTALYVKDFHGNDPRFVYYLLKKFDLQRFASGTGVPTLNRNFVHDEIVSAPSLFEQRRIVAILDEAFEGLAAASANYGKALQYIRRLSESSFGGLAPRTEQSTWLRTTVKEIAAPRKGAIRTGPFGSQLLHSEFVDEGIAVLGIDNVVANEFRWGKSRFITLGKYHNLERYRVYPGDVLISIMGTCGRCAVVPGDIPVAINTKHLCCITLDASKCLPGYLHAYFLHHPVAQEFLAERAKGSIMAGLNMGIIQELPVLLPPLNKQAEFLAALNLLKADILRLESAFRAKVNALEVLRRSLLDQAFSGNL